MDTLDHEALVSLARTSGWPSVSVYLPTHRITLETDHDRIRLRNLAKGACESLVAQGMRVADAEQFCAPLYEAASTGDFWRDSADGLAIFLSRDGMRVLRTGEPMPEQVVVGDRFYLRPLLAAHHSDQSFFALALDKNRTRLFRGDQSAITEVTLPAGTPLTFEDAMKFDDTAEPNLSNNTFHAHASSRGAQRGSSVFAGHGGEKEVANEQAARYARMVERGVSELLKLEVAPLLLFGIDRQLADYRLANTYDRLVPEQVLGASDWLTPKQIQDKALEVLAPHFAIAVENDLHELTEREGSPLTSHDPAEIVAAAASGRVKTLFFDDSRGPFGTLDRDSLEVASLCEQSPRLLRETMDTEPRAGDGECGWDLVDLAAAETALHGGEVWAFSGEDPPVHGVAAVYRY